MKIFIAIFITIIATIIFTLVLSKIIKAFLKGYKIIKAFLKGHKGEPKIQKIQEIKPPEKTNCWTCYWTCSLKLLSCLCGCLFNFFVLGIIVFLGFLLISSLIR